MQLHRLFLCSIFQTFTLDLESLRMKTQLLIAILLFVSLHSVRGQMFTPSASALLDGELNQAYTDQVIDFTVPQNATISGAVVEQAIGIAFPATQPVLGFLNIDNQTFDLIVSRTTLIVNGLPNGLSADCDATPCTYITNANGFITISGTPTETGQFTIDIQTLSEGDVDISSITGGVLAPFGLPQSLDLPAPVPSSLDESGYTLNINNTSGIEEQNELYRLLVYPNPSDEICTLSVNSKQSGIARIEIFSATGKLVQTHAESINLGLNQIPIDVVSFPTGLYFLKVILNGNQALIRIQKN